MIKVALLDDHPLIREGLKLIFSESKNIQVVYDSHDGYDFLSKIPHLDLDVAVLDIQMPIINGFELCQAIKEKYPDVLVLFLSFLNPNACIGKVMELGANGFISKNAPQHKLQEAILEVVEQHFYFDLEFSTVIEEASKWDQKQPNSSSTLPPALLSNREIEIISMIADEMSSKEIGDKLCISLRTVEMHRRRIMEKTASKNFIGVIVYALKHKIIELN